MSLASSQFTQVQVSSFAGTRRPRHAIAAPRPPCALRMCTDDLADVPLTPVTPPPPKRPLDELVDFPCVFTFKIVGVNDGDFLADITSAAAAAIPTEERFLQTAFRDRGKYRSITLKAPVSCSSEIYRVYEAVDKDKRVKFKF